MLNALVRDYNKWLECKHFRICSNALTVPCFPPPSRDVELPTVEDFCGKVALKWKLDLPGIAGARSYFPTRYSKTLMLGVIQETFPHLDGLSLENCTGLDPMATHDPMFPKTRPTPVDVIYGDGMTENFRTSKTVYRFQGEGQFDRYPPLEMKKLTPW